jgi:hypothetical protein
VREIARREVNRPLPADTKSRQRTFETELLS